jgi:BirA family transcriptional regulator, biotin operon repressor / biotin---[acetyl-CoA-carboxylase] ligase
MKSEILQILRESEGVVSGSAICARLGTSRVAVWKHIQKLQTLGYAIESGGKGYRLRSSPDSLHPWEFPGREDRMVYLPEATSTMDVAKDLARKQCPAYTVVIAGRQTQGRGRLRRRWASEEGGLYFTIVLRPRIPVLWSARVNFLSALVLAGVLREDYGVDAGLKWPNDILVRGRKLSGLLSEMESEGEHVHFINVGIGLNVNNRPPQVTPAAVSLKALLRRTVSRRELLVRFLDRLEERMGAESWETVIAEWKARSVTLNRPVRIVAAGNEFRGVAVDVDENGALLLQLADGKIAPVIYGDCFLA